MATPAQTIEGILERGHEKRQSEKQQLEHDEREAKLQTLVNSGLPPAQVQQGIRDIYGQDAPALQRHVENLFRRVTGKQPQGAQAPMRAADLASLEAQGTTPEQRQQANFRANTDYSNQANLQYEQQAAQQKQRQDFALIDQYVTDPEQNRALKQAYIQRVAEGTARPSSDQQKRSDYQALLASGQVPKDAQGNPLSYEAWSAYSTAQGRTAGTPSVQKVGSFGEFVTSQFGPQPTPEQILKARSQWAQAGAGTTTGTHVIAVPQPDNTIKYYQVTTTSSKSFPGAGGTPAASPGAGTGQTAPRKQPSGNPTASPKATGIPRLTGDVTGGHPPPGFTKAQNDLTEATKLASIADQVAQNPNDAINQKRLAVALERASAGRFTVQALDYIIKAGWGNTIEQWVNNPSTGALPADVMRQLIDGAHQNLKAAKDAVDAVRAPAPKADGGSKEHDPLGVL